jgi:hypothetical protein
LLPRFAIVAPEERSEAGIEGGGGGGANAPICACAWCVKRLAQNAKATKKTLPGHRSAPVFTAREDRSDQPIDVIPKNGGRCGPKCQIVIN